MVSILSFDSRSMQFLLDENFSDFFSSSHPIFYKNKIQKGQIKDGKNFYRNAIENALKQLDKSCILYYRLHSEISKYLLIFIHVQQNTTRVDQQRSGNVPLVQQQYLLIRVWLRWVAWYSHQWRRVLKTIQWLDFCHQTTLQECLPRRRIQPNNQRRWINEIYGQ